MKNKILRTIFLAVCILTFCGCSSYGENGAPYQISGKMVTEDSCDYENAGFDFEFYNRSEKNVAGFTIVFFLFDEDGNSPILGRNNIVLQIDERVNAMDSFESCVSIDQYLTSIPEEPYIVDFLYVSAIVYEDGTQWKDSFGFYGF